MRVCAILLAAGRGARFGGEENKIFHRIGKHTILERSVDIFVNHPAIDDVIIVASDDDINRVESLVQKSISARRVHVVRGGTTRQQSALRGLLAAQEMTSKIENKSDGRAIALVHDVARCLLPPSLIDELIHVISETHAGAAPAISLTDTIRLVDAGSKSIKQTLPRENLVAMQTPQGADLDIMLKASLLAEEMGENVTDDIELLLRIGYPVKLVRGDEKNIKITSRRDLIVAHAIICDEKES